MHFSHLQRGIIILATAILIVFLLFFHTPRRFVPDTLVSIPSGTSVTEATRILEENNIVTSAFLLRCAVIATGGASSMQAGYYFFEYPQGSLAVAHRLSRGEYGLTALKVLLPEGSSSEDMAAILSRHLPRIDVDAFIREAKMQEGYLFPDTYFFLPTATSGEVITTLRQTFDAKTIDVLPSATATPSRDEVIIMASILEEEAQTLEDRTIISGILWKRLAEGMRLQVDASFTYLLGKTSAEVTQDDLALDSPYNTYLYAGLPPGPITNPGLESIVAAANPTTTPYWFYLSDNEGTMHYAETFEEHIANKQQYISF
jgi:UPF0755 protein